MSNVNTPAMMAQSMAESLLRENKALKERYSELEGAANDISEEYSRICKEHASLKEQNALLTVQVQRRAEALAKAANMIESDPAVVDTIWFSMTETLWDYMLRIAAEPIDLSALTALPQQVKSEDARDAERLQFMFDDECSIESLTLGNGTKYRINWPSLEETQAEWFPSPREAIDAALSAQD